ncbi:MAG: DsbA family protein [Terriglobales bacterium]
MLVRRSILVLVLVCLGCSAQSASPEQVTRIERQVRSYYSVPAPVKIAVGPLRPSEFPGYDALTVNMDGHGKKADYDFLLSKDGKTLLRMTKLDLTKDPYAENVKKISIGDRPVRGMKDAKVVVVNYDDLECPYCSRMHQTLFPEILKEYGDRVEFVYKDYPLAEIHPWATHAAVDANCLAAQNGDAYWDLVDHLHGNQHEISAAGQTPDLQFAALDRLTTLQGQNHNLDQTKLQSCIKAQNDAVIKVSLREGDSLGVNATPTMFVNGEEVDGVISASEFRTVLDAALQQAGVPVPVHSVQATPGEPQTSSK